MNLGRIAKRAIPVVIGVLLVAVGLACLNYTKPATLPHHQEWATENARPEPNDMVFWTGVGSVAVGASVLGCCLGRR